MTMVDFKATYGSKPESSKFFSMGLLTKVEVKNHKVGATPSAISHFILFIKFYCLIPFAHRFPPLLRNLCFIDFPLSIWTLYSRKFSLSYKLFICNHWIWIVNHLWAAHKEYIRWTRYHIFHHFKLQE